MVQEFYSKARVQPNGCLTEMEPGFRYLTRILVLLAFYSCRAVAAQECIDADGDGFWDKGSRSAPTVNCPVELGLLEFFTWMRQRGYLECIVTKYIEFALNPEAKHLLVSNVKARSNAESWPAVVHFYDIIPNNPEATATIHSQGHGPVCQPSAWAHFPSDQNLCPFSQVVDYKYDEKLFEHTFGIDFEFIYHRVDIDYASTFGVPLPHNRSGTPGGERMLFPIRFDGMTLQEKNPSVFLEPHSLAVFSIDTWNGIKVINSAHHLSGGVRALANVSGYAATENWSPGSMYQHEWAHGWGLSHQYKYMGEPYHQRLPFSLDGLMAGDTYSSLYAPTDPVERYVLEPIGPGVFRDHETFAERYSQGILEGIACRYNQPPGLCPCGTVDLIITGASFNEVDPGGVNL